MIRILSADDLSIWKQIRLEGLLESPLAFGESHENELAKKDSEQVEQLQKSTIFAYFDDSDKIIGTLGFYINQAGKACHRGHLFCMYVVPQYRRQGIGKKLMDAAEKYAVTKVQQLHLAVVTTNHSAVELYKKIGFTICGTEPRSLLIDGFYYDEHLMVKIF